MRENLPEQLLETSQDVLRDCALPNGAIVAANSTRPDYPPSAENYFYSWGRDAAYQLYAAHAIQMPEAADIKRSYLNWLERSEPFTQDPDNPVIVKRYYPNGPADWRYGSEHQPDQAGALLWALHETTDDQDRQTDSVMRRLANGLTSQWGSTKFNEVIQDLWENQEIEPLTNTRSQVFTYTLTATIQGLNAAIERLDHPTYKFERDQWVFTRDRMDTLLDNSTHFDFYTKRISDDSALEDNILDASLSAVVFPFDGREQKDTPETLGVKRTNTVKQIGMRLLHMPEGVYRYTGDTYDGIARPEGGESSAGAWPLLTFWYSIAMNRIGETEHARDVYNQTLELLSELYNRGLVVEGHIPEQIFRDDERQGKGITPLAWSHAKYILSTLELQK